MRISDWSSDVCSSDLAARSRRRRPSTAAARAREPGPRTSAAGPSCACSCVGGPPELHLVQVRVQAAAREQFGVAALLHQPALVEHQHLVGVFKSEEHTSELQSLMRNSYAVICLKIQIHN